MIIRVIASETPTDFAGGDTVRIETIICLAGLLVAGAAGADIIEHITYTPTSLPSDQGWVFYSLEHDHEADVSSLQDGVLVFDTIGSAFSNGSTAWYVLELTPYPDADFVTFTVRARITHYETNGGGWHMAFSMATIYSQTQPFNPWFGLGTEHVWLEGEIIHDHDGTAWRDYTIVVDLAAPEEHELVIDGASIGRFGWTNGTSIGHAVIFGDRGASSNARVEVAEISVVISSSAPVAVEPTSLSAVKSLFVQ
jgi:hypothetical protein